MPPQSTKFYISLRMLDIFLVQMEIAPNDKARNFEKVETLTREIRKRTEDSVPGLIVLPEMFDINREAWCIKGDRRKPTGMKYYTALAKIHLKGIFGEERMRRVKSLFS